MSFCPLFTKCTEIYNVQSIKLMIILFATLIFVTEHKHLIMNAVSKCKHA